MAKNEETPLSRRLDEAADRSGLTNEQISEKLDMTAGNISHWRKGRHRPDVEQIQKFAQVVGASDYFLLTGREDPAQLVQAFQVARQLWRQAIARGEEAGEAWEAIVGQEGRFTEKALLVAQRRKPLALARGGIRPSGRRKAVLVR